LRGFTINEASVDMAYSSRNNLLFVANEGEKAYIPYRKNATGKSRGSSLWSKMYHYFQLNRDDFMEHYHKRRGATSRLQTQPSSASLARP
jgi:hypothetical protein